ncbi:MAG: YggT family protein [Solirubrobacterales bacterium]
MILAITRTDAAAYVTALVWLYTILILIRILITWAVMVPQVVSALQNPAMRSIVGFIEDVTDPYLDLWRKLIPALRTGSGMVDLSPIIAIFALQLIGALVARAIAG